MPMVRVQNKGQLTIHKIVRSQVGLTDGDLVEVKATRGKIVLTPKLVIDRSTFPNADREYTPAQRKIIDARLAESEEDLRNGRTFGPFEAADQAIKFLHKEIR